MKWMKYKTKELALKLEQKHEDIRRNKRQQKYNFCMESLLETHRECVVVAGLGMGGRHKSHKVQGVAGATFFKEPDGQYIKLMGHTISVTPT